MVSGLKEADRRVLDRPEVWRWQVDAAAAALQPGFGGFVDELRLAAAEWPFPVEEVRQPVTLWHGTDDASTPIAMAHHLAKRLPHATLRVFPGEGHFLLYDHAEEILGALATSPVERAPPTPRP
jgi:pimeloyl-ACP methyl ester carboxylesterase